MRQLGVFGLTLVLAAVLVPHVGANSSGAPKLTTGGPFSGRNIMHDVPRWFRRQLGPGRFVPHD